jgi:hypothetical protein
MEYFQTKNSNLGKLWRDLERTMLIYFMAILNILRPSGKFYGHLEILCHLEYLTPFW